MVRLGETNVGIADEGVVGNAGADVVRGSDACVQKVDLRAREKDGKRGKADTGQVRDFVRTGEKFGGQLLRSG